MTSAPLREATPMDRDDLLDLWVEAWTAAMPAIDFKARRSWFSARLDDLEANGAVTLVSRDAGGRLAGFLTLDPRKNDLDQLAVRPALQGHGLAGILMAEAKRLSPKGLELHVNQDNPRAVRFYEREGFVRVSAGTNPRSGLPVWRMEWQGSG